MKNIATSILIMLLLIVSSCKSYTLKDIEYIQSEDYKLAVRKSGSGDITVVFESALAEHMENWIFTGIEDEVSNFASVLLYNRAGLYPSEHSRETASLENAINDLDNIIGSIPEENKIILVGHSLGGAIIRAYAVQNPERISGLVFVDSSHEVALEIWKPENGKGFADESIEYFLDIGYEEGDTVIKEYREFENTLLQLKDLGPLPNIYVTTITAMQDSSSEDELHMWRNGHLSLGINNPYYRHIDAMNSGHYVQHYEPEIIIKAIFEMHQSIINDVND